MIPHEVALAIREALTIMIAQERVNRPLVDGIPCLTITYKHASRSAEDEAPFALSLPEEFKVSACCVENCVGAIVDTAAIMAWLAEGTSAIASIQKHLANEIRTFNKNPRATRRIQAVNTYSNVAHW